MTQVWHAGEWPSFGIFGLPRAECIQAAMYSGRMPSFSVFSFTLMRVNSLTYI